MIDIRILPAFHACLNFTTFLILIVSYCLIRKGHVKAHAICQALALILGTIFLISYLYYHAHHGMTRFPGQGIVRPIYFFILITHTILAAVIVPMILRTLYWAVKKDFVRHKRLARWTQPLWIYVSITGVIVYWMLYRVTYTA